MKKKIFILVATLLIIAGASGVLIQSKSKPVARELKRSDRGFSFAIGYDSSYSMSLEELGFSSIESVKTIKYVSERNKWMKEYGLYFLGDDEMTKFLKDNDFIIGDASRFLEEIPKEAGRKMVENFKKAFTQPYYLVYRYELNWRLSAADFITLPERDFCDNHRWTKDYIKPDVIKRLNIPITNNFCIELRELGYKVQIIAGAKSFNIEGMQIEDGILKATPPKDPIAVVKVNDGWVELANW